MDTFKRYPEVYPLTNISANSIVTCLFVHFIWNPFRNPVWSRQWIYKRLIPRSHKMVRYLAIDVNSLPSTVTRLRREISPDNKIKSQKRYCLKKEGSWYENINFLLFALRECPQESFGYSPFELLYERQIRGQVLRDQWFSDTSVPQNQIIILEQSYPKFSYDSKSQNREFSPGDKMLLFFPVPGSPLKSTFTGPYDISH